MNIRDKITIHIKKEQKKNHTVLAFVMFLALFFLGLSHGVQLRYSGGVMHTQAKEMDNDVSGESEFLQLSLFGDLDIGGYVESGIGSYDIFSNVSSLWKESDLVMGNLDCALIRPDKKYKRVDLARYANQSAAASLSKAGITTLMLANNHTTNCGLNGLKSTADAIQKAGMDFVGYQTKQKEGSAFVTYQIKGKKISVFSVMDPSLPNSVVSEYDKKGVTALNDASIVYQINQQTLESDLVIVYLNTGNEDSIKPSDEQQQLAHEMIDSGADLVVCTHPYNVLPVEKYRNGMIFYSLGNLVTDSGVSYRKNSILANVTVLENKMEVECIPVRCEELIPEKTERSIYSTTINRKLTKMLRDTDYAFNDAGHVVISMNMGD